MSEQLRDQPEADATASEEPAGEFGRLGGLSVEDDPDGTEKAGDLAGSATVDDASVGYRPATSEADKG